MMIKLELEQLQEYCDSVLELEVRKYTLAGADDSIQNLLKHSKPERSLVSPPLKICCNVPLKPSLPVKEDISKKWLFFHEQPPLISELFIHSVILIVSFVLLVISLILVLNRHTRTDDVFHMLFYSLIATLCALIIIMGGKIRSALIDKKRINDQYSHDIREYEHAIRKFPEEQAAYAIQVQECERQNQNLYILYLQQQAEKDADFDKQIKAFNQLQEEAMQITTTLQETALQLESLYGKDVIYPKYRDLIAISAICEYLSSGRCDKLEGLGGAYNLFEEKVQLNLIITKISMIIQQLDHIKNNQFLLHTQLSAANAQLYRITNSVSNSLTEIRGLKANSDNSLEYSAITSFCSQVTSENAKLISRLALNGFKAD